ncbi:MAG: hypothetical protein R6U10_06145 [Thermoplasmatota archaeon]
MTEHATVSIRKELHEEVQRVIADQRLSYLSVTEFMKEVIRVHLEQVVRPDIQRIIRNRVTNKIYRQRLKELFR